MRIKDEFLKRDGKEERHDKDRNVTRTKENKDNDDHGAWSISSAERILILRFSLSRKITKLFLFEKYLYRKLLRLLTQLVKAKTLS